MTSDVGQLFQGAVADGVLSKGALDAINVADIGLDIQAALGVSVDDVQASEVTLVTLVVDDSSSIRFVTGNTEAVRNGHNLLVQALVDTKQKDGILAMCTLLNGGTLYAYQSVEQAIRMDAGNFSPNGGTPLNDVTIRVLAAVVAKAQQFSDNGIPCRTVTAIITDGADNGNGTTAADVRKVVTDMLRTENHIVAGIGIDDGQTDFRGVFADMGIAPEWVLTPGNSPSEIRKAFALLSKSAVGLSKSAGGTLSQNAMGGFGAP